MISSEFRVVAGIRLGMLIFIVSSALILVVRTMGLRGRLGLGTKISSPHENTLGRRAGVDMSNREIAIPGACSCQPKAASNTPIWIDARTLDFRRKGLSH